MKRNKAVCVLLSSTLVLCGCYSYSSVAREEPAPADGTVRFYLNDGSYVESGANQHWRVEDGYQVSGDHYTNIEIGTFEEYGREKEPFSGVIAESDIQRIAVEQFDMVSTVLISAVGVGLITAAILFAANYNPF